MTQPVDAIILDWAVEVMFCTQFPPKSRNLYQAFKINQLITKVLVELKGTQNHKLIQVLSEQAPSEIASNLTCLGTD